jgi:hypothetical protein
MTTGKLFHGATWKRVDQTVTVEGKCVFSGEPWRMVVNAKQFDDWQSGTLIQHAFPGLSADEREMLMSGIGPISQSLVFDQEEDGYDGRDDQIDHYPEDKYGTGEDLLDFDFTEPTDDLPF